nr:MAG TPA: hypothetical protein [Caudoviricetes sp.]
MLKKTDPCPVNRKKVKKNLRACSRVGVCLDCDYRREGNCVQLMASDALAYVEYLEGLLNDVPGKI